MKHYLEQPYKKIDNFISIILPVYNGEKTIQACLESLLTQSYQRDSFEIIVVDNNSNDQTCEIVQQYPVKLLHERDIQTSYAARNRGIKNSKGEILAFTDADCIADTDWLYHVTYPFIDDTVVAVGGRVLDREPENDVERFIASLDLFSHYQEDDSFLRIIMTNNAAFRRESLLSVGCFNSRLFTAADIDLAWRLQLRSNSKVVYAPKAVIYHHHRSSLLGMAKQFQRHGFGEIFLDAMYKDHDGYQRKPARQLIRMGKQTIAILTYLRSLVYRTLLWKIYNKDRVYILTPFFWLVAEGSNLWGKWLGLLATRFFTKNPAGYLWVDPGER
jgi:glycosyltransferase involved in cell wall biosynthesis